MKYLLSVILCLFIGTAVEAQVRTIKVGEKTYKLGRIETPGIRFNTPRIQMAKFLLGNLPTPPASVDYSGKSVALSDIYLNNQLGDCVVAGGWHIRGLVTSQAGKEITANSQQIVSDYSAIGGYVPGNPRTDNGCDMQTAMSYWIKNGFAHTGGNLLGFIGIDPTNRTEVKQSILIFQNNFVGLGLPDAWISSQMPQRDGFVWDVAGPSNPMNGHAIIVYGYNNVGVLVDTWGLKGTVTWAAYGKYMSARNGGECYTIVSKEMIAAGQTVASNGFDWQQLSIDFGLFGGQPFVVIPPPPPPPQTGSTITLTGPAFGLAAGTYQITPDGMEHVPIGTTDALANLLRVLRGQPAFKLKGYDE